MKTLYLVRHAKSSKEDPSLADFDRPLLPVGTERITKVAALLKENGELPQHIISSPALRAKETAAILAKELLKRNAKISYDLRLYEDQAKDYYKLLHELPDTANSVMLIGHNNDISDFAGLISRNSEYSLSTSSVVGFELLTDKWSEAALCQTKEKFYIKAKKL